MNTLIIKAHPSTRGFTHTIADVYRETAEDNGREVAIIDLYTDEQYQQPFLSFEDPKGEKTGGEARKRIQEEISWADELVLIYPTWWASMPAILKNFLDNNFTSGFAYTYESGKPEGLLKGKDMKIFTTADGPKIMYMVLKPALSLVLNKAVFGFCGMKIKNFDIFSNMVGQRDDASRAKMLDKVRARV